MTPNLWFAIVVVAAPAVSVAPTPPTGLAAPFAVIASTAATAQNGRETDSSTVSLRLGDAVDMALRRAPTVRSARASHEQAELTTLRANLDRFVFRVDAQVQEIWAKTNIGGSGGGFEGFLGLSNLAARLEVPVFSGFRVEANVAQAEHLERAAWLVVLGERRATALSAARAYWAVRKVNLLSRVNADAIRRLKGAEAATNARVDAGLAPPVDANRALARRRLQEAQYVDTRGQQRELERQLAVLLGIAAPIALIDEPVYDRGVPALEPLVERAYRERPELLEMAARIEAQHEAIRIALSDFYPQLGVFGLLQYGNNPSLAGAGNRAVLASANPFGGMVGDIQLGVQISLNVFDTLNTYTSVKSARIEAARLFEERGRIEQQVDTEVRTAHAKVMRLVQLVATLDGALEIANDNVQITETRYQDGEGLVLEVLEAQLELSNIERQRTDAVVELMTARAELDAAVGAAGALPPKRIDHGD